MAYEYLLTVTIKRPDGRPVCGVTEVPIGYWNFGSPLQKRDEITLPRIEGVSERHLNIGAIEKILHEPVVDGEPEAPIAYTRITDTKLQDRFYQILDDFKQKGFERRKTE